MRMLGRLTSIFVCCAVTLPATAHANESDGGTVPAAVPDASLMRYDEDWSVLDDARVGGDLWYRPLKNIKIGEGPVVRISTGLEARVRTEIYANTQWGDVPDERFVVTRLIPHLSVEAGPARVFVQPIIGIASGFKGEPGPVDRTGADLLQGFVELSLPVGGDHRITIRGGRMMYPLGLQRLLGARYGTNIPLAYDGGVVEYRHGNLSVDFLTLQPVEPGPDNFDDRSSPNRHVRGIYGRYSGLFGGAMNIDAYFLDYRRRSGRFLAGTGFEKRRTLGLHVFGTAGRLDWDIEGMFQSGQFADRPIRAWSVASQFSFKTGPAWNAPTIGTRFNIISGDRVGSGALATFNALFPRGKYFGEATPIGPANLINFRPDMTVPLTPSLSVNVSTQLYWRYSIDDAAYDIVGGIVRAPSGSRARYIGTHSEVVLTWTPLRELEILASYSKFSPGRFLQETGPSRTMHVVAFEAIYRF